MRRVLCCLTLLIASTSLLPVNAWSNGGWSTDPNNPAYGTHDWLAHHALDWVPDNLDFWIRNNLAIYLYGTELPDNGKAVLGDGIGDTTLHHVYYRSSGQLQDDASARRARETCDRALSYLTAKDYRNAAKWMGAASHYICDLAVFGHVMGSGTDWGSEKHHSDYEDWVNYRTNSYDSQFTVYLRFDGKLETISAYDAVLRLARDTTFDSTGKGRTAKWMDDNYNPANPSYQERIGESLNLAVNLLADVIYSISQTEQITTSTTTTISTSTTTSPLTTTTTTTTSLSTSGTTVSTTTSYTTPPRTTTSSSVITTATTGQTPPTSSFSTSQTRSTTPTVSTTTAGPPTTTTQYVSGSVTSTPSVATESKTVTTQTTAADRMTSLGAAIFLVVIVLLVAIGISRMRRGGRETTPGIVSSVAKAVAPELTAGQNFCNRCQIWSPGSYCPRCGQKLA